MSSQGSKKTLHTAATFLSLFTVTSAMRNNRLDYTISEGEIRHNETIAALNTVATLNTVT